MSDLTYATIGAGTVLLWLLLYAAFAWKAPRRHSRDLQGHYYDETHPYRANVRKEPR
jgi:hypothetical protein